VPTKIMHGDHHIFIEAVKKKKKLQIKCISEENGEQLEICCAPMDYHPDRRASDRCEQYFFWCSDSDLYSFEIDRENLPLCVPAERLISMQMTDQSFDPSRFINLRINWNIPPRHWRFNPISRLFKKLCRNLRRSSTADRRDIH